MKKTKDLTNIVVILSFIISIILLFAFTSGSASGGRKYFVTTTRQLEGEDNLNPNANVDNAYVTLDIDRGGKSIAEIYLYLGHVYIPNEKGKVTIYFDFKTEYDSDDQYDKRITREITVSGKNAKSQYYFANIYESASSSALINYSRVKIHTPNVMQVYEVAFLDKDGNKLKTSLVEQSNFSTGQGSDASVIIDNAEKVPTNNNRFSTLSYREISALNVLNSVITGTNYQENINQGSLSLVVLGISTAIFGFNTAGARALPTLFMVLSLLVMLGIVKKLFAKSHEAIIYVAFLVMSGVLLSVGMLGIEIVMASLFVMLMLKALLQFYLCGYKFQNAKLSIFIIAEIGVYFSLAISCMPSSIYYGLAIIAMMIMSFAKQAKLFKVEESSAKGLDKENVYQKQLKIKINQSVATIASLIVLPIIVLVLIYGVLQAGYIANSSSGILNVLLSDVNPFTINGGINSTSLLQIFGFGSEKLYEGGYAFINIAVSILSFISLLLTTLVMIMGRKNKYFKNIKAKIATKYKILTIMLAVSFLPLVINLSTASVIDYFIFEFFYIAFIPLACICVNSLIKNAKLKKSIFIMASVVSLLFFAFGMVGYLGIEVNELAYQILYKWQI